MVWVKEEFPSKVMMKSSLRLRRGSPVVILQIGHSEKCHLNHLLVILGANHQVPQVRERVLCKTALEAHFPQFEVFFLF